VIEACTFCDPERFWSYRREGEQAGRMISFIRVPQL
jgi:copper oxidase (laccase) domain-containing protein